MVLLNPYYRNLGKRLVKSPRLYFMDSGLACYLTGTTSSRQLMGGPLAGAILEAEVICDVIKWFYNNGEQPSVYSWRTSSGAEVDCVIEYRGKLWPIEVKMSATYKDVFGKWLAQFCGLFPECERARIIHLGDAILSPAKNIDVLPFSWMSTW